MRKKVLVVEGEPGLRARLTEILREGKYSVTVAPATEKAMDVLARAGADMIVLGHQPGGFTTQRFCEFVRRDARFGRTPILLLADGLPPSSVVALIHAGADVHLPAAMSGEEILAHVRALFRRAYAEEDPAQVFERPDLALRAEERRVVAGGKPIDLTRKEFELLRTLMGRPRKVIPFQSLLKSVWGYDEDVTTKTLQVHITRLRTKLGPQGASIKNFFGVGYAFSPDDDENESKETARG